VDAGGELVRGYSVREEADLTEFDRQVANLVAGGHARAGGLSDDDLRRLVEPLREQAERRPSADDPGRIPFAIVVTSTLVPTAEAMTRVRLRGRAGVVRLEPIEPSGFVALPELALPPESCYLVLDVDTGRDTLGVTPDDAYGRIAAAGRSPLTIDEAVAVVTHHPDVLRTRNCFSILGSRCGDRRVPALWVSGGRPRLGWCWAGNPHSWLGSASCGGRAA
jgi:hypothetical protein